MMHPSHHQEFDEIRGTWRRQIDRPTLEAALDRLKSLADEFPYVLAIGHEIVLVLEKLGRIDEAITQLKNLERQFKKLDEETLCRWGKLFKKQAITALQPPADLTQALQDLDEAARYYARAFEVQRGFYPRINELSLQFYRAAVLNDLGKTEEARLLLEEVRRKAAQMLADSDVWRPRKDDDHVWVLATKGEAAVLAHSWTDAEARYAAAVLTARSQRFYLDVMRDQMKLLVDACRRLGILPVDHALADPDAYFHHDGNHPDHLVA